MDHDIFSLDQDRTAVLTEPRTIFGDPVCYSSNSLPHPRTASSDSRPGLESALPKPEPSSALSSRVEKRKANTLAARRYRQNRLDKVAELELALKATHLERDALKVQVAKLEGENHVLRKIVGEKMKSC